MPNVAAAPLEADVGEWHVSLRSPDKLGAQTVLHLVATFPDDYPAAPPALRVRGGDARWLSHPNIVQPHFDVCLDMLEVGDEYMVGKPFRSWTSAYSITAVLMQLQLLLEIAWEGEGVFLEQAAAEEAKEGKEGKEGKDGGEDDEGVAPKNGRAGSVDKDYCCASPGCPAPSFAVGPPTPLHGHDDDDDDAEKHISGDILTMIGSRKLTRARRRQARRAAQSEMVASESKGTDTNGTFADAAVCPGGDLSLLDDDSDDDTWQVVAVRRERPAPSTADVAKKQKKQKAAAGKPHADTSKAKATSKSTSSTSSTSGPLRSLKGLCQSGNQFELIGAGKAMPMAHQKLRCSRCKMWVSASGYTRSQLAKETKRKCGVCVGVTTPKTVGMAGTTGGAPATSSTSVNSAEARKTMTKAQLKNLKRAEKRKKDKAAAAEKENAPCVVAVDGVAVEGVKVKVVGALANTALAATATSTTTTTAVPAEEPLPVWKHGWIRSRRGTKSSSLKVLYHTGATHALHILSFLNTTDIAAFGVTCRWSSAIADDGALWRKLFARMYPQGAVTAENLKCWKSAFVMERNNVAEGYTCWHTKKTFKDDVLGIPIVFTVNPRTGEKDYITSTFDCLSLEAFQKDNIRKGVWHDDFQRWLPLYINDEHFERALPYIRNTIAGLAGNSRSGGGASHFHPNMVLDVFARMMNTQVVLIADKGLAASENALQAYFAVFHLLLALVKKYPKLMGEVDRRLREFISSPFKRVKKQCPSLGLLLPMLTVSPTYTWRDLAPAYLGESFDRGVLWNCRDFPELAKTQAGKGGKGGMAAQQQQVGMDKERLDKTLTASKVSLRLTMFHVYFVTQIARPAKTSLADVFDDLNMLMGRPSLGTRKSFHRAVNDILETKTWPEVYRLLQLPCPTPGALTRTLVGAVQNSLDKGYHRRDTKFHKIHKSGVSKILLKGESYTAAPDLKQVRLEERWKCKPNGGFQYLDASCLLYDFAGKHITTVDYARTRSTQAPGVSHSGDVIDHEKNMGTHIITIDLHKLPKKAASLYFTVSAFAGALLRDIVQPSVHLLDSTTGHGKAELCSYEVEDLSDADLKKKAVVMCVLRRDRVGGTWSCVAIGQPCQGSADNYGPMVARLDKLEGGLAHREDSVRRRGGVGGGGGASGGALVFVSHNPNDSVGAGEGGGEEKM
jgi:stress response protein SCP2/ubiquitin-protein ligase